MPIKCSENEDLEQEVRCEMEQKGYDQDKIDATISRIQKAGATSAMMRGMDAAIREAAEEMAVEVQQVELVIVVLQKELH